ncbi:IucA/IucC family protein [Paenibacillus senegalimassiliensis]|uniref:IucA/IucC family protein n=1 Tax=Paenibacillus senegalimassiliensis TaxID=1737426 RepID=UPI001E307996|nr:IucA/IucC family protein [Paenibacillus senegalimassiliensis]
MASLWRTANRPRPESLKQANAHTCKLLLNCYIRELAQEKRTQIRLKPQVSDYAIAFPASGVTVFGQLAYYSAMGEHEYNCMNWFNVQGEGGGVEFSALARWIMTELEQTRLSTADTPLSAALQAAFMDKINNSCRNLALYIERSAEYVVYDYCSSEQALIYGHPFHPFPKHVSGFTGEDVQRYSPELRTSFQLAYFAVSKEVYREEWVAEELKIELPESMTFELRRQLRENQHQYTLLPAHPWQYEHVLALPKVDAYVRSRKLIPLGVFGPAAYPTTSVRTVYIPEMNCNLKLPLNLQITNMIRTNSDEQMRRTMDASRYLLQQGGFGPDAPAHIAYETGVTTCAFNDEAITRLFTVAYRPIAFDQSCTFVMASLVEAPLSAAPSRLMDMINKGNISPEVWFEKYLEVSLLPLVRLAWTKGIHFEAHLQNTLLTIRNGLPESFIVRDLEGVSVEQRLEPSEEQETAPPSPLFYSREQAWSRTSYYLFVNHLGSLIHAMARDAKVPEEQYWYMVRQALRREQARGDNGFAKYLLTVENFPAKRNMLSCLMDSGENPSYAEVPNMLREA